MKLIRKAILFSVLIWSLTSCGAFASSPAEAPSLTELPTPNFELGEIKKLPDGGFSFQPIVGYKTTINNGNMITVMDSSNTHTIFVMGLPSQFEKESPEEAIDAVLDVWEERGFPEFIKNETFPITIDGVEGIAVHLTGTTAVSPMEGQIVLVMPSEDQLFCALAITLTGDADKDKWTAEGSKLFSTLLDTIRFTGPRDWNESICPVSSDDTYGYSKDNPIRIGGGSLDGPARVESYLGALNYPEGGLDGVSVYSTNTWSLEYGDSLLNAYEVTYNGKEAFILYFDEYTYEELLAPSGFSCWTIIPLVAP